MWSKIKRLCREPCACDNWAQERVDRANRIPGKLKGLDCPLCLNRGYTTLLAEDGKERVRECACMARRRSLRAAARSGLQHVLEELTFARYQTPEPWQQALKAQAQAFAENPDGQWFYIGGNPGCGKTHLCTAICGELLRAGHSVRYFVWPSDIRRLKSVVNDDAYDRLFSEYAEADVLYIDDLFKTRRGAEPTSSDVNRTFELVNRRDQQPQSVTLFSSERSLEEVLAIDEATGSRIFSRCRAHLISVGRDPKKNWRIYGSQKEPGQQGG